MGVPKVINIAVIGSTGSGKSSLINSLLMQLNNKAVMDSISQAGGNPRKLKFWTRLDNSVKIMKMN